MQMWHRGWLATGLVATTLCGCVNLPEVRQFAAKSAEGAAFQRILDDYQGAPGRQERFVVPGDAAAADARAWLENNAAERKEQVRRAKLLLTAVCEYMQTLGALAGDELVSADQELGGLVDASVDKKWLPEDQAGAAKSLVDIIADTALSRYRQRQLSKVIERANTPLQAVLQHLQALDAQFEVSEKAAQEQMDGYYRFLEKSAARTEPVAALLVRDRHAQEDDTAAARLEALATYTKTLQDIAAGHQKLFDHREHLDPAAVRASIADYARRIAKLVDQLKQSRTS
jgi:hypothetical protein